MLAAVVLLAGAAAASPSPSPPPTPRVIFTVPAACADVYADVYPDLDPSWTITVRADEKVDLPSPEQLDAFVQLVPGLQKALAGWDALDRDLFWVRVHRDPLATLARTYPKLPPKLLRASKLQACRDAAAAR